MFTKHRLSLTLTLVLLLSLSMPSLALADGGIISGPGNMGQIDRPLLQENNTGFATGGGWFLWPGSQDKTTFAFTVKGKANRPGVSGSLLVIRHTADGHLVRIKSTSLANLVIQEANGCRVASFSGTGRYRGWDAGLKKFVVNNAAAFSFHASDCGEPGKGVDSIWLSGTGDLVMTAPASAHLVQIGGGNIAMHAARTNNPNTGTITEPNPWQPGRFDKIIPPPRD